MLGWHARVITTIIFIPIVCILCVEIFQFFVVAFGMFGALNSCRILFVAKASYSFKLLWLDYVRANRNFLRVSQFERWFLSELWRFYVTLNAGWMWAFSAPFCTFDTISNQRKLHNVIFIAVAHALLLIRCTKTARVNKEPLERF